MLSFTKKTVYVELLNEGTPTWRPVEAIELGANVFVLLRSDAVEEEWQFNPGEIVSCENHVFKDGSARLIATSRVDH